MTFCNEIKIVAKSLRIEISNILVNFVPKVSLPFYTPILIDSALIKVSHSTIVTISLAALYKQAQRIGETKLGPETFFRNVEKRRERVKGQLDG